MKNMYKTLGKKQQYRVHIAELNSYRFKYSEVLVALNMYKLILFIENSKLCFFILILRDPSNVRHTAWVYLTFDESLRI